MVLFALILVEIGVLLYLHFTPPKNEMVDHSIFKKEVEEFYASAREDSSDDENISPASSEFQKDAEVRPKRELFAFNPNNLPESEWKRLGFSEKQIRPIKNYESKGGKFRSKDDVRKMYSIHEDEYKRIEPFIAIPETSKDTSHFHSSNAFPKKGFLVVDIGTADSTELEKLPMVGTYLARKIFVFREKLGGFFSIDQLKEMYGMRDSVFQIILPHLALNDSTNLRRINLNTAEFAELNKHPYINSQLANVILNYRKQHGAFQSVDEVRKTSLVNDELYRKIAPYLRVE
jgi:competence protein ComEA